MTHIKIRLIPDGLGSIPSEATDHTIVAEKLKGTTPDGKAPDWGEIGRVVPSNRDYLELRIENSSLSDYDDSALTDYANSVASISGIKKHPDGWVEVEDGGT